MDGNGTGSNLRSSRAMTVDADHLDVSTSSLRGCDTVHRSATRHSDPGRAISIDNTAADEEIGLIEVLNLPQWLVNVLCPAHHHEAGRTAANALDMPGSFLKPRARREVGVPRYVAGDLHVHATVLDELQILPDA
jgi:hypothetical protein